MPRCQECSGQGKQAWWGVEGVRGALLCGDHKTEGMINTKKKPTCKHLDCTKTNPAYGDPGGKRKYCGEHAKPGMIDLVHRRCDAQGCTKQATRGEYCNGHSKPQQGETERVERKPVATLTAVLADAARAHQKREGWCHPSEILAHSATTEARNTPPSAGEGGEQPRKPAPPSAATTDEERGVEEVRRALHRAPARPRPLVNDAIKLFMAHKQAAPVALADNPPHRSGCATTKATLEPVAASPAVGEGEGKNAARAVEGIAALLSAACVQGEGERGAAAATDAQGEGQGVAAASSAVAAMEVDTTPEPAREEERGVLAQLVDVTEATGAGQGAAASPASVEMDTIGGLGVLAAVAEAVEAAGVQSEGEEGAATEETAAAPQGTSRPSGSGGGRGGGT